MPNSVFLQQTTVLTEPQQNAVRQLVSFCRAHDRLSLSYPSSPGEADCHYLLSSRQGQLLSILALTSLDSASMECIAFTHPYHRRHHYFFRLLSAALKSCEDMDLFFPVSGSCMDTIKTLHALGAQPECQEYQMEISLTAAPSLLAVDLPSAGAASFLQPPSSLFSNHACWTLCLPGSPPVVAGSCLTSPASSDSLCLHHLEVPPQLRRQGYGTIMILQILRFLSQTKIRRILLQVSKTNGPALALYKKTGFQITETLSYYLY